MEGDAFGFENNGELKGFSLTSQDIPSRYGLYEEPQFGSESDFTSGFNLPGID